VLGYLRAPGVLIEPLGEGWAAYSSLSGETHLVNAESVEVLNQLDTSDVRSPEQVCERLATEYEVDAAELLATLSASWEPLVTAGLVRRASSVPASAA
jgi:PqqD family protein of HPr-rel-A system